MKKYTTLVISTIALSFFFLLNSFNEKTFGQANAENLNSAKFQVKHPGWIKSANIYEVNLRQYTKSGTINEFRKQIPRLKKLGVDILWFMPINPIGEKNRKGKLGSYYSVKDYKAVNPEYGTMADFKAMVKEIHKLGMYVIIDWVPNHTSWDNKWTVNHPEYYSRDSSGKFLPPHGTDWTDVIQLNYQNKALRNEMINCLKFWIDSANIDGYRCDFAVGVPTDFWNEARFELDKVKPVFMLAEAEQPDHQYKAFDAGYGWEFHHLMHNVAKGEKTVADIDAYFAKDSMTYAKNAIHMYFTTNHDENSWNGTEYEKFGDGSKAFAVLYYTVPGMPLIYSGQEAGLNKRLLFFEKDTINWDTNKELAAFYKSLNRLKKEQSALWNAENGARMKRIKTNNDSKVFAFMRENEKGKVLVILNLTKDKVNLKLETNDNFSNLKNYFNKTNFSNKELELKPWEYQVFVK
jgi:glycosidase